MPGKFSKLGVGLNLGGVNGFDQKSKLNILKKLTDIDTSTMFVYFDL